METAESGKKMDRVTRCITSRQVIQKSIRFFFLMDCRISKYKRKITERYLIILCPVSCLVMQRFSTNASGHKTESIRQSSQSVGLPQ